MPRRCGFTLVEFSYLMVIVVFLTAISIPIYQKLTVQEPDAAARESLLLIRDAICIYASEHDGDFPGADGSATTFKREIGEQLQSRFPRCPVGPGWRRGVEMVSEEGQMYGDAQPTNAWKYNYATGKIIVNYCGRLIDDPETTYDRL